MTALTVNNHTFSKAARAIDGAKLSKWPVADAVKILVGSLVGLTDDGYAAPLSTTVRYGFVGISQEEIDNTAGANAAKYVQVIQPPFLTGYDDGGLLKDVTYADERMGATVFCNTDNVADVTLSPDGVTDTPLGQIGHYDGAKVTAPVCVCSYAAPTAIGGMAAQTLTADVTLVVKDAASTNQIRIPTPPLSGIAVLSLDPGGAARTVTLPTAALAYAHGVRILMIDNAADDAEVLTVTDGTLSITPTQNECAILVCDGAAWFGLVGSAA